jgi:hypothetical protein
MSAYPGLVAHWSGRRTAGRPVIYTKRGEVVASGTAWQVRERTPQHAGMLDAVQRARTAFDCLPHLHVVRHAATVEDVRGEVLDARNPCLPALHVALVQIEAEADR